MFEFKKIDDKKYILLPFNLAIGEERRYSFWAWIFDLNIKFYKASDIIARNIIGD